MEQKEILDNLLETAGQIGIEVRKVQIDSSSGGGLCNLRGKLVIFLDNTAPLTDQIDICINALKNQPELENIYLRPQIRELIER